MELFESEEELKGLIRSKILLIDDFVKNKITDEQFDERFENFFFEWCLDGHDSDEEDRIYLKKYEKQIQLFDDILHDIFMKICSDENSVLEIYIVNGRISRKAAFIELNEYIHLNRDYFDTLIDELKY